MDSLDGEQYLYLTFLTIFRDFLVHNLYNYSSLGK